jgi:alpha-ribazole phosphatase
MAVTRFWCVRHGPTHAKTMVGWTDLPADLSDLAALARLSDALPTPALILSSDLIRARATADALAHGRQRLPDDPTLREMHFGAWEMRSFAEIEADTPDHIRAFWETPGDVRPPGGESWHDLAARVTETFDRLAQTYAGRDIIVVAHFGTILAAAQRADDLSTDAAFTHRIDPLSLTRITHDPDGWALDQINHRA